MPDENRFAGIGEAVEGDGEPSSDADPADETPADEDSTNADESVDEESANDATDSPAEAAFPFDDTVQKSVYVRPETFEALEDAEALVDARLRTDHDLRDLTRREFFDAVFREAAADTDQLVERIRRMREE
ncbi:hypothetical protein [Halostella salina]|uniref:hypothetical protein n=1 Tax=Halostella salina TaxID=1547897 RepID=UPI000EF8465C|nr:hypothetical protein [Halostella salina]